MAHKAPLFSGESINSKVVQYVYRGDKIFIHDKEVENNPLLPRYDEGENAPSAGNRLQLGNVEHKSKRFYETLHRLGGKAYILSKHIKIVFNDSRELNDPIGKREQDLTDYRLKEPLREGYPLTKENDVRTSLMVGFGNQRRNYYPYSSNIEVEKYNTRYTVGFVWLNPISFDEFGRYYYGWDFHFHNEKKVFYLADQREATEDGGQFYFGPTISYDGFRNDDWRMSFTTTFGMSWTRILITQRATSGNDQNLFQAFSFSPKAGMMVQKLNILKEIDLVAKAEAQYELSHTLRPSSQNGDTTFWQEGEEDSVGVPSGARVTLYLGIQNSF